MSRTATLTDAAYGASVLAALRCECGKPNPPYVAPGTETDRFDDLFPVARGELARGWCAGCHPTLRQSAIQQRGLRATEV